MCNSVGDKAKKRTIYEYCQEKQKDVFFNLISDKKHKLATPAKKYGEVGSDLECTNEVIEVESNYQYSCILKDVIVGTHFDGVIKENFFLMDRFGWDPEGAVHYIPNCAYGMTDNYVYLKRCYKRKRIKKGIFLLKKGNNSWFHFIFESLAKLTYLDEEQYKDYPILIEQEILNDKSCDWLLKKACVNHEIIGLEESIEYRIDELLMLPEVAWGSHNKANNMSGYGWSFDNKIQSLFQNWHSDIESNEKYKYVVLIRNDERLVNQKELCELLNKKGFLIIDPSRMDIIDEIEMFVSAKILVGVVSGAFANLVFARHKPYVFSICPYAMRSERSSQLMACVEANIFDIDAEIIQQGERVSMSKMRANLNIIERFVDTAMEKS